MLLASGRLQSPTRRGKYVAAEAILGAPEGSLDARKVLIKEVIEKVLTRTVREHHQGAGGSHRGSQAGRHRRGGIV